jgi:parvulin-like peptidyl-prolyl isomerase
MPPRRLSHLLLLLGLLASALAARGGPPPIPADAAATVNGKAVPLASYTTLVDASKQKVGQVGIPANWSSPEGARRLTSIQYQVLKQVVRNAVILQLANERQITVSDAELAKALAEIEAFYGGPEGFEAKLVQDGLSREDFGTYYRYTMLDRKLRQADPTGYPTALEQAIAQARVQAYVGPCATDHQYPRCLGDS